MDDAQVFKVPAIKRKRPSLYCRETLDGLDEVWQKHPTSSLEDTAVEKCAVPARKQKHEKSNTSELSIERLSASVESQYCYRDNGFSSKKYAIGLVREFSQEAAPPAVVPINGSREIYEDNDRSLNLPSNSVSPNSHCVPDVSRVVSDDSIIYSDILILKDESMANADSDSSGSDVDWDSLTPPAPRSPGDQTVPDLYDVEEMTTPSSFLMHSYDSLASMPRSALPRAQVNQNHSVPVMHGFTPFTPSDSHSFDHTVPDFFF